MYLSRKKTFYDHVKCSQTYWLCKASLAVSIAQLQNPLLVLGNEARPWCIQPMKLSFVSDNGSAYLQMKANQDHGRRKLSLKRLAQAYSYATEYYCSMSKSTEVLVNSFQLLFLCGFHLFAKQGSSSYNVLNSFSITLFMKITYGLNLDISNVSWTHYCKVYFLSQEFCLEPTIRRFIFTTWLM